MKHDNPTGAPAGDRILALRMPAEAATDSGIIIPETARKRPQMATYLMAGPGRRVTDGDTRRDATYLDTIGIQLTPGDALIYGDHSGVELNLGGRDYVILAPSEILYVIPHPDGAPHLST